MTATRKFVSTSLLIALIVVAFGVAWAYSDTYTFKPGQSEGLTKALTELLTKGGTITIADQPIPPGGPNDPCWDVPAKRGMSAAELQELKGPIRIVIDRGWGKILIRVTNEGVHYAETGSLFTRYAFVSHKTFQWMIQSYMGLDAGVTIGNMLNPWGSHPDLPTIEKLNTQELTDRMGWDGSCK